MFIGHYGIGFASKRWAPRASLGVVSHWVLDLVVHRPDLPLYPGSQRLRFGLWNNVAATSAPGLPLPSPATAVSVRPPRVIGGGAFR
jgi:hypothetical protein